MRTLLRTLILLALVVWLGGLLFFPIVAGIAFPALAPDTHAAGAIVGACLRVLHAEGLVCGALLIILLTVAHGLRIFSRPVHAALVLVVVMLALTAFSQFSILPRMEVQRIAAGGAIDSTHPDDPHTAEFNRLHRLSVSVEEGVMAAGLLLVVALAWAESKPPAA